MTYISRNKRTATSLIIAYRVYLRNALSIHRYVFSNFYNRQFPETLEILWIRTWLSPDGFFRTSFRRIIDSAINNNRSIRSRNVNTKGEKVVNRRTDWAAGKPEKWLSLPVSLYTMEQPVIREKADARAYVSVPTVQQGRAWSTHHHPPLSLLLIT